METLFLKMIPNGCFEGEKWTVTSGKIQLLKKNQGVVPN